MRNSLRLAVSILVGTLAVTASSQQSISRQSVPQQASQTAPKPSAKPSILPDSNVPVKLSDSDTATVVDAKVEAKKDYLQEAFVIEKLQNRYRFEADGTGRKESIARIRVQSEAGVQQWGQL